MDAKPSEKDTATSKPAAPFSIYDAFQPGSGRRDLKRLPRLAANALSLVWTAARHEVLVTGALQLGAGIALAAQLLIARSALAGILAATTGDRSGDLMTLVPGLTLLAVISTVTTFVTAAAPARQRLLGELVSRHATGRIIDVATAVDLQAFETSGFHDRLLRAMTNAQIRPTQLVTGLIGIAAAAAGGIGVAIVLATIEPVLIALLVLAGIPLWLANKANSNDAYRFAFHLTPADRERSYLQGVLTGRDEAKEVRIFSLAPHLRRRHRQLWDERITELRRVTKARLWRSLVASAVLSLAIAGTLVLVLWLVLRDRISVADAGVAALAVQQMGTRLRGFTGATGSLFECSLFLEDVESFLALPTAKPASSASAHPSSGPDRITIEKLSFTYPGTTTPVLRDVTCTIERGDVVALVGENGSGKTTLAKLLCGLYRPTEGRILWDGTDAQELSPDAIRGNVAVIFQDFVQYQLDAHANVALGDTTRFDDTDRVEAAARQSGAHEFLARLPHGYDTLLSRAFLGGAELSIGQWQRVALARAFFCDAPILILDEPTAALDPRAEQELFDTVRDLARGRTVLLISHRFSTVRSADRILVLQAGRVVEQGTHETLMTSGGHYAELFSLQARAYT